MNYKKYEAIILCGGLGTRFREVSDNTPKILADVSGKKVLEWLVEDLISIGIKKIILATGYLSSEIELFIKKMNFKNFIVSREDKPLGTGGAIKNAEKYISGNNFFVLNGDSRIKYNFFNLLRFHLHNKADMSLLLSSITKGSDFGKVKISVNKKILGFTEKKNNYDFPFINSGVYCMEKSILEEIKFNCKCSLENELLPQWVKEKRVFGHTVNIPFVDIGTRERYFEANFD